MPWTRVLFKVHDVLAGHYVGKGQQIAVITEVIICLWNRNCWPDFRYVRPNSPPMSKVNTKNRIFRMREVSFFCENQNSAKPQRGIFLQNAGGSLGDVNGICTQVLNLLCVFMGRRAGIQWFSGGLRWRTIQSWDFRRSLRAFPSLSPLNSCKLHKKSN